MDEMIPLVIRPENEDGKDLHLDKKPGYKRTKRQRMVESPRDDPFFRDTSKHVVKGIV